MTATAGTVTRQASSIQTQENQPTPTLGEFMKGEAGCCEAIANIFSYMHPGDLQNLSQASLKITGILLDHHFFLENDEIASDSDDEFSTQRTKNFLVTHYGLEASQVRQIPRNIHFLPDYISVVASVGQLASLDDSSNASADERTLLADLQQPRCQQTPHSLEGMLFPSNNPASTETIRLILAHPQAWGIPTNSLNKLTQALQQASTASDLTRLRLLLSFPLASHVPPKNIGDTLIVIARNGDMSGLKALMKLPQAFDIPLDSFARALLSAAEGKQPEMVKTLLKRPRAKEIPPWFQNRQFYNQRPLTLGDVLKVLAGNNDTENIARLLRLPQAAQIPQTALGEAFINAAKTDNVPLANQFLQLVITKEEEASSTASSAGGGAQASSSPSHVKRYIIQALTNAIEAENIKMIRFLLGQPIALSMSKNDLYPLLKCVASAGNSQVLRRLFSLEQGSMVDRSVLTEMVYLAGENHHSKFIRYLFSCFQISVFDLNNISRAMIAAVGNRDVDFVDYLLTLPQCQQASNSEIGFSRALANAAKSGHIELVTKLLTLPQLREVSSPGISMISQALEDAVTADHLDIVRNILELPQMQDVSASSISAISRVLQKAVEEDHFEMVRLFRSSAQASQIAPRELGSMLATAAKRGSLPVLEILFSFPQIQEIPAENPQREDWNASPRLATTGFVSILTDLMKRRCPEMVNRLLLFPAARSLSGLALGAVLAQSVKYDYQEAALQVCAIPEACNIPVKGREALTGRVGRSNSAQIDRAVGLDEILSRAVEKGHVRVVASLCSLPQAPSISPNDYYGIGFALTKSAENGRTEIARLLLSLPQSSNIARDGSTFSLQEAIDIATQSQHAEIALLLQAHMQRTTTSEE